MLVTDLKITSKRASDRCIGFMFVNSSFLRIWTGLLSLKSNYKQISNELGKNKTYKRIKLKSLTAKILKNIKDRKHPFILLKTTTALFNTHLEAKIVKLKLV